MRKIYFFVFLFFILILTGVIAINFREKTYDPEQVVAELYSAIEQAKEKGDYKCCIDPACTMCYLGHWKFEKGTCLCDDAIAEGREEDVCPECKKGLEEGLCNSVKEGCEI
jgi:hypothetical protein